MVPLPVRALQAVEHASGGTGGYGVVVPEKLALVPVLLIRLFKILCAIEAKVRYPL